MGREELIEKYTQYKCTLEKAVEAQSTLDNLCTRFMEEEKKEESIRKGAEEGGLINGCLCHFLFFAIVCGSGNFIVAILIAVGTYFFLEWRRKEKHGYEYEAKAREYHSQVLEPLKGEIFQKRDYIDKLWENWDMKALEADLPEDYRSLDAIDFLLKSLKNKRADTEKEAFNLYEEHLRNERLLNLQQEVLQTQQESLQTQKEQLDATREIGETSERQTRILKDVQKTQKKMSRQSRYGNVINTLDYLFKK